MSTERRASASHRDALTSLDVLVAARLKDTLDAPEPPPSLFKPVPWPRTVATFGAISLTVAFIASAFFAWVYPPELVRDAMVHEHREATLRGDFQQHKAPMFLALGLNDGAVLPGLMQLQRPCDIGGRKAYHVTTFLEKGGGMVTILAFEDPVADAPSGRGSWLGRHWRFVEGIPGKTILLLADNPEVLGATELFLRNKAKGAS